MPITCLQCFDTVGWLSGREASLEKLSNEVLVWLCLERGADYLHMVQLMPLHPQTLSSLASFNPDWFYLSGTSLSRLFWKRGR